LISVGEFAEGYANPRDVEAFMSQFRIVQLSRAIAYRMAAMQAIWPQRLGENDAWIAATALVYGAKVVGRDARVCPRSAAGLRSIIAARYVAIGSSLLALVFSDCATVPVHGSMRPRSGRHSETLARACISDRRSCLPSCAQSSKAAPRWSLRFAWTTSPGGLVLRRRDVRPVVHRAAERVPTPSLMPLPAEWSCLPGRLAVTPAFTTAVTAMDDARLNAVDGLLKRWEERTGLVLARGPAATAPC